MFKANCYKGTACFFAFSLITEGTTEKVLQFIMPAETLISLNKKCIFEHYREFHVRIDIID
jgi:hypothetical protein